jgi:Replication initiator protein A
MNSKPELHVAAVPETPPERDPFGRDEMNLAEFPITLLTDRAPAGLTMITREVQARDERTGMLVTRKVTVTGSDVYGIPTAQDNLVLLALIYLTKRSNNFRDRRVWFTRSELIKVLEWPDTGPSYGRVYKSFCRWGNVFVLYENSWWEKASRAYSSDKGFGIIDNFELNDSRSKQMTLFKSNFSWNEVFFESLESGFVRSLDLKTLLRLRHPTSQQMYRYLGKHFYRSPTLTLNLRAFACEHVGLDRGYKDNGKLKEKLQPALDELETIGFLEPMSRDERYTKLGRGEWTITLVRKAEATPEPEEEIPSPEHESSPAPPTLETALNQRGVTLATASELLRSFPADQIQTKLEVFDWLVSKQDKRVSKNPGGYLVESIRKNYSTPKGFETQTERNQRLAVETEQRRKVEAAKRQAAVDQQAREEAERARIQAYWDSLSAAAQEQLWTDALANPTLNFMVNLFRRNRSDAAGSERYRRMILDAHIINLLDASEAKPSSGSPTQ